MPDLEPWQISNGRSPFRGLMVDEVAHPLCDRFEKRLDFIRSTLNDQFDAAIGQIPHISRHAVCSRDGACRIAKADALDAARVVNLTASLGILQQFLRVDGEGVPINAEGGPYVRPSDDLDRN